MKHGDPLKKAVSSGRITSQRLKIWWRDSDYRARMTERASGPNNANFRGAKEEAKCTLCGLAFTYYPSNHAMGLYCSLTCVNKSPIRSSKLREANLGRRATDEVRKRISQAHIGVNTGPKHPRWKGGISKIGQKLRGTTEYARWRMAVFEKDDYTCQRCGARGGKLRADHYPYPFALYPDFRLEVWNGRTLCRPCDYYVTNVIKEWKQASNASGVVA
jgi:5-methylcytosine-specific restriction endonuclease McrA